MLLNETRFPRKQLKEVSHGKTHKRDYLPIFLKKNSSFRLISLLFDCLQRSEMIHALTKTDKKPTKH